MKKLFPALILSSTLLLASCGPSQPQSSESLEVTEPSSDSVSSAETADNHLIAVIEGITAKIYGSATLDENYFYDEEYEGYYVDYAVPEAKTEEEAASYAENYLIEGYEVSLPMGYVDLLEMYYGIYTYYAEEVIVEVFPYEAEGEIGLEYFAYLNDGSEDDPLDSSVPSGDEQALHHTLMAQIAAALFGLDEAVLGTDYEYDGTDGSYWTAGFIEASSAEEAIQSASLPIPEGYVLLEGPAYYEPDDFWYVDYGYYDNQVILEALTYESEDGVVLQYAAYLNDGSWGSGEGGETGQEIVENVVDGKGTATIDFSSLFSSDEKFVGASGEIVMVTASQNTGSNPPMYYVNGTALRLYAKNTLTISVGEGYVIDQVVLVKGSKTKNPMTDLVAVGGTFSVSGDTGTLTCKNADTVTFSVDASNGYVPIASIEVHFSAVA